MHKNDALKNMLIGRAPPLQAQSWKDYVIFSCVMLFSKPGCLIITA
jgi:hypothetical protein